MIKAYLHGIWMMIEFYIFSVQSIHALPKWIRNPNTLERTVMEKDAVDLSVPAEAATNYVRESQTFRHEFRSFHQDKNHFLKFKTTVIILSLLRLLTVLSAWHGLLSLSITIILLQIIVAPYSIIISFAQASALIVPIYCSHYVSYILIQKLISTILNSTPVAVIHHLQCLSPFLSLTIGPYFIIIYFFLDLSLCCYCQFVHFPNNIPLKKTVAHIIWGFLNAKSYTLVVLLHAMSAEADVSISIIVWIVDAYYGITSTLARVFTDHFYHWLELHYTFHTMGHLPIAYNQAHKFHHVLHGSSAFDAHSLFGNGMPEEFFFILLELMCVVLIGLPPALTNFFLLKMIIKNKFAHTENPEDDAGDNFHTGHHRHHVKNFGHNCLLDMLFSTCESNIMYRMRINNSVYQVEKKEEEKNVQFCFTKISIS